MESVTVYVTRKDMVFSLVREKNVAVFPKWGKQPFLTQAGGMRKNWEMRGKPERKLMSRTHCGLKPGKGLFPKRKNVLAVGFKGVGRFGRLGV